jgi:hypothetical protein
MNLKEFNETREVFNDPEISEFIRSSSPSFKEKRKREGKKLFLERIREKHR